MLNGESPTINNMHRGQNSTLYTARALSYNHKGINTHTHTQLYQPALRTMYVLLRLLMEAAEAIQLLCTLRFTSLLVLADAR